jgi:thiamine biosynthesis lipoprotein
VLTSESSRLRPWTVGIVDPEDRAKLLTSVVMTEKYSAVATSGSAERGEHIWNQITDAAGDYVQVSVLAPDMITADALATAIVAGGQDLLDLFASNWDAEALAVNRNGNLRATPGFRAFLAT